MQLARGLGTLTYCLNTHAVETWPALRAALTGPVRAVKAAVCPDAPFAVGLRVSAEAVRALRDPAARDGLRRLLEAEGYRAITVNGFPYGPFHGVPVKAAVYQPDWRMPERLDYTCALADLMASLVPEGETVSLSTVPGTFRPLAAGAEAAMARRMLDAVAHCVGLRARTGVTVALALEPEPFCFLETVAEAVAFFEAHLFAPSAVRMLAAQTGLSRAEAADALPRHLGLCYDVCHAAVAYEGAGESLEALRASGIPVHKLQLSSALRVAPVTPERRAALTAFDEPVYLHQVFARRDGALRRNVDLGEALARGAAADGEEWRVHFHLPVFLREVFPRGGQGTGAALPGSTFLEAGPWAERPGGAGPTASSDTGRRDTGPTGAGSTDAVPTDAATEAGPRDAKPGAEAATHAGRAFSTTQGFLAEILALHARQPIAPHLEVETYTWDVLPPGLRCGSVAASVARELAWVRAALGS
jgi:sugar phosphate isomerase/epimerase